MRAYQFPSRTCQSFKSAWRCSFAVIILLLSGMAARAQNTASPERGFNPSSSYAIGGIETINTTSGNLMLHVPIGVLPAGRGGLSAKLTLLYNSKLWDSNTIYVDCPRVPHGGNREPLSPPYSECVSPTRQSHFLGYSEDGGWRYGLKYELRLAESAYQGHLATNCNNTDYTDVYLYKMQVVFPDGGLHDFRLQGYTEPDSLQTSFFPMTPGWRSFRQQLLRGLVEYHQQSDLLQR